MTRIISGVAGSLRLEVPPSGTRPTSDRVREAIFSTLDSWGFTTGTRVLDLYAGSGALGLEAASRGAADVTFVERHPPAAAIAVRNAGVVRRAFESGSSRGKPREPRVRAPHQVPNISVARQSVQTFLDSAEPALPWDVVMIDPPYDLDDTALTANLTALAPHLAPDAAVMVERSSRSPEPAWPETLRRVREKRYGETTLWWAEPVSNDELAADET